MKIICATDFTRRSDQAALASAAIARQCGASLELVHLYEPVSKRFRFEDDATLTRTLAKGASARLEERAQRLAQTGVESTWKLLPLAHGHAMAETLREHAAGTMADLLVISTHGKSGSKLWPMGSLAAAIVDVMPFPVLVVQSAKPFLSWQEDNGPPLRVFVGLDLSEESGKVLEALRRFHFDCRTTIVAGFAQQLHPVPDDFYAAPIAVLPYAEDEALLESQLRAQLAQHLQGSTAEVIVETGFATPAHHLVEMAQHEACDLVAVGHHQRHGLDRLLQGSVSRGVLRETTASILSVPLLEQAAARPPVPALAPSPAPSPARWIFCAADFSSRSGEAALAAQELAIRFGTRFEIAHVVEDYPTWPGLPDDTMRTIHAGAMARLDQFADPLALRGLTPKTTVLDATDHESVADCILKYLELVKPLLAVVSTHGKSGGSWWPPGSTAIKIAHASPVPVLVVQSAEAFQRWVKSGKKLRVLGAVDANGDPPGVLEWMKKLGEAGPCSFTLAHIDQTLAGSPPPGSPAGQQIHPVAGAPSVLEHGLQAKARSVLGETAELTTVVKQTWENVVDALLDMVRGTQTDLIILGAHQWHGIGRFLHKSISRGLLTRGEASLLCLPVTAQGGK